MKREPRSQTLRDSHGYPAVGSDAHDQVIDAAAKVMRKLAEGGDEELTEYAYAEAAIDAAFDALKPYNVDDVVLVWVTPSWWKRVFLRQKPRLREYRAIRVDSGAPSKPAV